MGQIGFDYIQNSKNKLTVELSYGNFELNQKNEKIRASTFTVSAMQ